MPVSLVFATLLMVGVGLFGVLALVALVTLVVRRPPALPAGRASAGPDA